MNGSFPNPLLKLHRQSQAEMIGHDQIEIVNTFGEPQVEYAALHKACGMIDRPQRGILELTGKDRLPFLNNLLTNQTWDKASKSPLAAGAGVYTFFLNVKGRIVADMNVIERGDRTLLEMDARLVEPIRSVFDKYLFTEQVTMSNRLGELHQIALCGPGARKILEEASGRALADFPEMGSDSIGLCGMDDLIVWRDDLTGRPGYHLVAPAGSAESIWQSLLSRYHDEQTPGKRELHPTGWAAFNAARIEAGRPLFGIDFDGQPVSTASPGKAQREQTEEIPAGPGILAAETGQLDRAVSFTKGCYLGQEIVARMHARGQVARQLVGIRMENDALPMAGVKIYDDKDNEVGGVTSSTISPVLSNAAICLGYVKRPLFSVGTRLLIPAEGAMRSGEVVKLPFVTKT